MRSIATRATWRLSAQWNRFKVQFRYDEIPHTYTNTARTLYTQDLDRAVLTIPLLTRNTLQGLAALSTSLPSTIQTQLVPSMNFIVPAIERRAGTVLFAYDLSSVLGPAGFLLARA